MQPSSRLRRVFQNLNPSNRLIAVVILKNDRLMKPDCLTRLEQLILSAIPVYICLSRTTDAPLFAVRLNFYDTHAPRCYFAFALTHLSTAKQIISERNPHRFNSLWATSEAGADERFYFPATDGDDFAPDPVLDACYAFLCDDDVVNSYEQYARAICAAAFEINANFFEYFPHAINEFCLIPGDDSFEFLGDDEAIRLSLPQARISELIAAGYLDGDDSKFGIYPADIYGG